MYVSDLRGMRVMCLMRALRMGVVEEGLLDPSCRHVAALRVRGNGRGGRLVPRGAVKHIGRGAIVLAGSEVAPAATRPDGAARLVDVRALTKIAVISEWGDALGRLRDAVVDPATLSVDAYVVARFERGRVVRGAAPWLVEARFALGASREFLVVAEAALDEDERRGDGPAPDDATLPSLDPWLRRPQARPGATVG